MASNQQLELPAIAGGLPIRAETRRIIFGAPVIEEEEIREVLECLRSGWIGQGRLVEQLASSFATYKSAPYAVVLNSGTAALHLAMVAMGIGSGDEVIAPAMTFCSTIHSIIHTGATPVLVDCDPRTFSIDPAGVEARITSRTKAIVVVHMCGRCCEMDRIMAIARRHNLRVIEDCAHAIESHYHGQPAGLIGDVGCFSFYATKNMACGDGGALITSDRRLARRVKLLSLHGMTSDAWRRSTHRISAYRVPLAGYKCNLTDMAAALGIVQLRKLEERAKRRERLWGFYGERLRHSPVELPPAPEAGTRHAFHLYTVLLSTEQMTATRRQVLAALRAEGIGAGVHYVPVHQLSYYRRTYGYRPGDFPNAAWVGERTLSLPLTAGMTLDDAEDVCRALHRVLSHYTTSLQINASSEVTA